MGLRLRPGVCTTDTSYGTVLLDEHSGDYWQLNPTGARIVQLLLAGDSPAQAATTLAEEFEVDEPRALRDVTTLLEELRSARLVAS